MRFIVFLLMVTLTSSAVAENMRVKIGTELAAVIMNGSATPDSDIEDCPCKGTKFITHGDGHRTPCPCGDNCKCNKPQGDMGDVGDAGDREQIVKDIFEPKSQCGCDNCDCKDCGCLTGECKCPSEASAKEDEDMPAMTVKQKYDYVLYHMGAEWCGPCREMLKNVWPNDGFDEKGNPIDPNDDMKKFLADRRIRLVILDSTVEKDKPYFKSYGKFMRNKDTKRNSRSYPTILMFSVDDYATPVLQKVGGLGKAMMQRLIEDTINEEGN